MCDGVNRYIAETVTLVGKMPTTCAVYGCKKRQSSSISRSFYRIPQDTDRRRKWLAFIGRKTRMVPQSLLGPFYFRKKANDPLDPDYVPSKKCDNSDSDDKSDESEDEKMDESVARYNRIKRHHEIQATRGKECRLEEDIRKQAIRGTIHDHSYCRERNNAPAEARTDLVLTEVEWQQRKCINASQSGSSGVPCEVGKYK